MAYLESQRQLEVKQREWDVKEESLKAQLDSTTLELQSTRETYELAVKEADTLRISLEQQSRAEGGNLVADPSLVRDERFIKVEKEAEELRQKNEVLEREL